MDDWASDRIVDQWLHDNDGLLIPLPNIESEPHLLISKVRKHYMDYLIKLLSSNYESHQKLINKNVYLPSAIWRCAKTLEMSAAKASMVIQLYRQNITTVIKDLKENTKKGKLHKKLFDCLRNPPQNEQKTQTSKFNDCNCKCTCNLKKKPKIPKALPSDKVFHKNLHFPDKSELSTCIPNFAKSLESAPNFTDKTALNLNEKTVLNLNEKTVLNLNEKTVLNINEKTVPNLSVTTTDIEMQSSDDLMQQLEKLFESENDEDIFDNTLFNIEKNINVGTTINELKKVENIKSQQIITNANNTIALTQSKPLDERLALLSGLLVNKFEGNIKEGTKGQKARISKWMCEEYFLKAKLFELLDEIRDRNRCKLIKIKNRMLDLFGCDSDDEGVLSPIEETEDFITSCKERITPWVVRILTPYYVKGRIRGKAIFKSLAKHLIQLIYQCSKYPYEYEIESFVKDFLESHTIIRCEADFQRFRIENI